MGTVLLLGGNINFGIMSSIEQISRMKTMLSFGVEMEMLAFGPHSTYDIRCVYLSLLDATNACNFHFFFSSHPRIVHELQMPFVRVSYCDDRTRCELCFIKKISVSANGSGN